MKRTIITAIAAAAVIATVAGGAAYAHGSGQGMGQGMMGQGMMGQGHGMMGGQGHGMGQGYGMGQGHGMMDGQGHGQGHGMGYGMMGQGGSSDCPGQQASLDKELTTGDVKAMMEKRLTWQGNPNLKVGKVVEKDSDTITATIVTKDDSLVRTYEFDRKTGRQRPAD